MADIRTTTTNYVHSKDPNLLNVHKAMVYRDDEPHLRVTLGSDNITISGDVNLVDTVNLSSATLAALETVTISNTSFAITNFPTTSTVYQGTSPWVTTVTNWPALQYVNGVLYAVQSGTWSVGVSGSVSVSNFTSTVNVASMPAVSGTVAVSSLPAVTGTVTVNGSVTVTNFTSTVNVATLPAITGTVVVSSLPAVTGTVTVSNFTSTVNINSMPAVSGTVVVSNFTSTVRVDNFPTSVTVTNFTSTVFVSNTLTISNTSFAVTNFPTTSTVYQGTNPWNITGTVVASNFTSTVNINSMPSITINTVTISNTSIAVTNFPTTSTVYQGTSPWTVTGTVVSSNFTSTVQVANTVTVNQGTNPWTVTGNVNATITGTSTTTLGTGSTDAFGRLRVSQPYTLFDSRARYYDHNEFSSSTSTGGTVVYDANGSTYQLNVTAANGSSVIRETKRVFPYQPGKSLLVMTTFCMNTPKTNLRQRVGYFTTNNGIYFENDGTYNYLVIRSYSSGALVEDRVRQDAWDNPFAGLNVDRTQIFWTDVEWLGVGSVRCGFVVNGAYVLCHTFHHANVAGNTTTYMTTAVLPVRYEITNTAGTSGASMMRQICSTVISEGGYNAFTYSETAGRGTSVLRLSSAGTYYPVVSIRLDSTRLDAIVLPRQVDVLSPTVNYYRWKLVLNPTLTGATFAGHSASGTVEYDTAATAISGGTELQAGYVSSRELSVLGADEFAFQLGRTLAGVSDIVTLAMAATSNNADVLAQIGWQEIT
jgi:hypothetical protein